MHTHPSIPATVAAVIGIMLLTTCSSPTDSRDIRSAVTYLDVDGPPSLLVNERGYPTLRAKQGGREVSVFRALARWSSSDTAIARVTAEGVITAVSRGTTTIEATYGGASGTFQVHVKARVRVTHGTSYNSLWSIGVGDTLKLTASFVDIDGAPLGPAPSASWSSNKPDIATVSSTGVVLGVRHGPTSNTPYPICIGCATVTATTDDGMAVTQILVADIVAGRPAAARFVHVAAAGDITFVPSQGDPVTLTFGQSIERPITSGRFAVHVIGLPGGPANSDFQGIVAEGDQVSLYAVAAGNVNYGNLTALWSRSTMLPADSGLIRFVSGSFHSSLVYQVAPGAPVSGVTDLCYFDLGSGSYFYRRPSGPLDLLVGDKFLRPPVFTRIPVTVPRGGAVTYVILGNTPDSLRVIAFPDP